MDNNNNDFKKMAQDFAKHAGQLKSGASGLLGWANSLKEEFASKIPEDKKEEFNKKLDDLKLDDIKARMEKGFNGINDLLGKL